MIDDSRLRFAGSVAALACVAAFALTVAPVQAAETGATAKLSRAAQHGKYLVSISGCHDWHTPFKDGANGPEPDMTCALSGHPQDLKMPPALALPAGPWLIVSAATNTAHAVPWGVSFTANLTPDAETGLGKWTVNDFKRRSAIACPSRGRRPRRLASEVEMGLDEFRQRDRLAFRPTGEGDAP